jgi:hypothetical protein
VTSLDCTRGRRPLGGRDRFTVRTPEPRFTIIMRRVTRDRLHVILRIAQLD